jgi:hypothetical protein
MRIFFIISPYKKEKKIENFLKQLGDSPKKKRNISANVPHFAMFGAGTILARSATPAPNMSGAAKCVLGVVQAATIDRLMYSCHYNHSLSALYA